MRMVTVVDCQLAASGPRAGVMTSRPPGLPSLKNVILTKKNSTHWGNEANLGKWCRGVLLSGSRTGVVGNPTQRKTS